MSSQQQGRAAFALLGIIAAAIVVALFGLLRWTGREDGPGSVPAPAGQSTATLQPQPAPQQQAAAIPAPPAAPSVAPPAPSAPPAPEPPKPAAQPAPVEAVVPSFDVVRIEPNGESVIAGRGAPGATIELLRDGQVHARAAADASGLFALVPPALPPGSHQITLQAIAPDGKRERSRDSVSVVISEGRNARPLVALASPDKPTVLLSNPEPPEARAAQAPAQPAPQVQAGLPTAPAPAPTPVPAAPAPQAAARPVPAPTPRAEVKIATVEAEDNGRLFVSGQAAPGATVRLYLNDTFIAPGSVGGDGNVSFAIGRGVRPGDYRIRLDDVDPVSGGVKSRAEVAFNVPVPVTVPPVPPVQAPSANLPAVAAAPPSPPPAPQAAASPAPAPAVAPPAAPAPAPDPSVVPPSNAKVASAAPEPRDLPPGTIVIPDVNTAIISRGDNLWRISQRIYGQGLRYTEIYGANRGQIRNPNLIYPGQVFVLPGEGGPKQN